MALDDAPRSERSRFWKEHNEDRVTLNDHGHRLKTVESRVDRLEAHMSEQYGAVLTKLDGVSLEVRSLNNKYIASEAAAQERERVSDKSMSMKWPLVISVFVAVVAVGALLVNIITLAR